MIKKLFAGFDGGGSKTKCVICDEKGNILGAGQGGASNYRYCGEETAKKSMRDALKAAFEAAKRPPQRLCAAYVSSATIPTFGGDKYVDFFASCVDAEHVFCEGDLYPIWYGAVGEAPAVVTIVGTGSVSYLFRNQTTIRAGGWGRQLGDEGSGYDIGLKAMKLALRMYDGRNDMDKAFYEAILKHFDVDSPRKLIAIANGENARSEIATAAKTVCELSESGNESASRLLDEAANEIYLLIKAVLDRDDAGDKLPLILSGGLVGELSPLLKRLKAGCEGLKRLKYIAPVKVEPATVAAALALKNAGLSEASEALLKAARGE